MRTFEFHNIPVPVGDFNFIERLKRPYAIEIGAGTGDFALSWARENSEISYIAIEKTSEKFAKFLKKNSKQLLPNLFPIQANAINFVAHWVPEHSLSHCFINYPNPYPKSNQANKRFHNMPFMNFLKSRMVQGGELHFSTNLRPMAEEAKFSLTQNFGFALAKEQLLCSPELARTAFERKYLLRGESCWRLFFINQ